MEERGKLEERVRQEVNAPKHSSQLQDILDKMGRVIAKKRAMNTQKPRLVYDDRVWLGNFAFASDKIFLKEQEISTVISCLQIAPAQRVQGIEYKECYLKDGEDTRFEGVLEEFNKIVQKSQGNIYVHCFSGKSRSVALVLSLFMRHKKLSYDQACERLAQLYPVVQPNNYFQKILRSKQQAYLNEEASIEIDLLGHNEVSSVLPAANNEGNLLDISEPIQNKSPKSSPIASPKKQAINLLEQEQPQIINLLEVVSNNTIENSAIEESIFFTNTVETKIEFAEHKSENLIGIEQIIRNQPIILNQTSNQKMNLLDMNSQTHELLGQVNLTYVAQPAIQNLIGFDAKQEDGQKLEQTPSTVDLLTDQPTEIIYTKTLEVTKIQVSSQMNTEISETTQANQEVPVEKAKEQKSIEAKVEVAEEDEIVEKGDFTQKKRKPKKKKR